MKIGFLFGSPKISGGSYVILQHAQFLMKRGHSVDLITLEPVVLTQESIWHDALKSVRFVEIGDTKKKRYDIVFATWWISPFHLHRIDARQYAYFVQSIEAYFFNDSNLASQYLAHASYNLGLPVITEAIWIKEDLENRFHSDVFLVENGIRKEVYKPYGPKLAEKTRGNVRCLIEGAVTSPFKNIAKTVDAVHASKADEIWLLTPSDITDYPKIDRVISNIPIHEVPQVYRSCDIIVKQSSVEGMFGPPLEMFHCGGTAVVSNVTGFDQYIKNEVNALVTNIDNWYQITDSINRLCSNPKLLKRLQEGARQTADAWPSWSTQSAIFEEAILEICKLPPVSREKLAVDTQHCLNQHVLIQDSLKEFYVTKNIFQITDQDNNFNKSPGERLYQQQLAQSVQPATRLTKGPSIQRVAWNRATRKFTASREKVRKIEATYFAGRKRVFGFSISNEHIEEIYHPIAVKAGWETLYMCTRPKGYFSLNYVKEAEIPDENYIVSNWINEPSLLYKTIEEFDPDLILFHNGNHPAYQNILLNLKSKFDTPIAFSELGWFPQKGHIYFDPWGTNGASRLCAMSFEELTGSSPPSNEEKSPLSSKGVVLALQLENDTNTLVFSPYFRSNWELIENVLASVPPDFPIYIKPHPLDHNAHRYERFIGQHAKIVSDPMPALLRSVGSVIATNSTVLLEALDYSVNIYSCGVSILSNKGIAIEFDNNNLADVWQPSLINNQLHRQQLKAALESYQLNLENIDTFSDDTFYANPSIKILIGLMEGKELLREANISSQDGATAPPPTKPGSRIFVKSIQASMAAMSRYDVISFDIFDTLLVRDLYAPQDIFLHNAREVIKLTGDSKFDHKTARIGAERVARSYNPDGEVTFDNIYVHYLLATGLPADIVEEIKKLEIKTELCFLKARKSALKLFNYAKVIQRKIVIISDFYLGSEFVRTALVKAGFDLTGVHIYVSSDLNLTKKHGDLFDKVAADLDLTPNRILHIGDNFHVDTTNAIKHGFNVIHIPSPRVGLDIAPNLKNFLNFDNNANLITHRNLERSIVLGIMNNGLFDDPFDVDLKSVFGNDHKRLGYTILGPLLAGFTLWLRKQVKSREIDTLLFLARDGWVMEQAFNEYNRTAANKLNVDFAYVAASRRITDIISYGLDFENINRAVTARYATSRLGNFLKMRLDLDEDNFTDKELSAAGYKDTNELVTLPKDKVRVLKLLQTIRPKIIKKSDEYRENYIRYFQEKGVNISSRIGLVDIGYFGTMQKTINQIIGKSGETINGFYIATRGEARNDPVLKGHMFGYLADSFDLSDGMAPRITAHLAFLEQIFSAPHSSFTGLSQRGNEIELEYMNSTSEAKQWSHLQQIHEGALQFIRELAELTTRAGEEFNIDRMDHSIYFAKLFEEKNREMAELFKDFILENHYNGAGIVLLGESFSMKANPPKSVASKPSLKKSAPKAPPLTKAQYKQYFNQGCALYHQKEYASALKHLETALKLQTENPNLLRVLAEALLKSNRRKEAIIHLEKAYQLVPDNGAINRRLRHMKYPLVGLVAGAKPFPVPSGY